MYKINEKDIFIMRERLLFERAIHQAIFDYFLPTPFEWSIVKEIVSSLSNVFIPYLERRFENAT